MEWRTYIIDTFNFNDQTNMRVLDKIELLEDKTECIKHFSHLVNCQYKWMARILHDPKAPQMSWWEPVYELAQLAIEWKKSLQPWFDYMCNKSDEDICKEVTFIGFDGATWAASPKDIALQLNYHSIHHRAQIQLFIRSQGIEPDFIDYIGTRYRKLE